MWRRYVNNIFCIISTVGVVFPVLIMETSGAIYFQPVPLAGLFITSIILFNLSFVERLKEDVQDTKELENYIKGHFRRVTFIEMPIDKR